MEDKIKILLDDNNLFRKIIPEVYLLIFNINKMIKSQKNLFSG